MKRMTHDEIIAAHDAPSSVNIAVTSPFTRVTVKYPNSSWFILTLDNGTGVFSLASDWGDYIYRWNLNGMAEGETFDAFIFGRADAEYIAEKAMSKAQRMELDIEGTNTTLTENIQGVYDEDEDGEYDEDQLESDLRQLQDWSTEEELREMTFYLLEDYELQDSICEKETFRYAVFTKLIVPTFKRLWAEREARIAQVAAEQAAHDALYPQHAKFAKIDLESRAISEFMDFCDEHHYLEQGAPTQERLLGEFYEIDLKEFANEKERMLAAVYADIDARKEKEKTP